MPGGDEGLAPRDRLARAVATGQPLDLRSAEPGHDDPAAAAPWDASRTITAQMLADLLTDPSASAAGRPGAVKLRGARISGSLDLEGATLIRGVFLIGCSFDETINLGDAQATSIRLAHCVVPAINADRLRTSGDFRLENGSAVQGGIRLAGARIGGQLSFAGAALANPAGPALHADRLTVDLDMFCRTGFIATGEVRLVGATIGGVIDFSGATLTNPGRIALNLEGVTTGQGVFCREGFTASGEVRALAAHIGGQLDFSAARLINAGMSALVADRITIAQGMSCRGMIASGEVRLAGATIGHVLDLAGADLSHPAGTALNGQAIIVGHSMFCRAGFTARGEVRLSTAQIADALDFTEASLTAPAIEDQSDALALDLERADVAVLALLPRTAPGGVIDLTNAHTGRFQDEQSTWPAIMRLDGFTYDNLEDKDAGVHARLEWLTRSQGGYTPGIYDQLAAAYRSAGDVEAARRVGVAKQWHRRRGLNRLGKAWNWLLYLTVGYGYRTWLAGVWLVILLAAGTAVFANAYPAHMHRSAATVPAFNAAVYTLDVLLPVINLGQRTAWVPDGAALVCSWILTAVGWVLAIAVVGGLTSAFGRRD